ncbi:MAG: hypothetical protein AABO41_20570 [Acidobacteriota bacterium]
MFNLHNADRQRNSRNLFGRLLVLAVAVGGLLMPLGTQIARAQECRNSTDLTIQQVLSSATIIKRGDRVYDIRLRLNTGRHAMNCSFDICPDNADRYIFRPTQSSNIEEATPSGGCFDTTFTVVAVNRFDDVVFGFRVKYQQDFFTSAQPDPRRTRAQLPFGQANLVEGVTIDLTEELVTLSDG